MNSVVAVIDPAVKTPELDVFNRLNITSPIRLTYHLPAFTGTESLSTERAPLAGIVVLGSASSVHDAFPWQEALRDWLVPQMKKGVPTLGLCFGHQFIAHCLGGKVGYVHTDQHKEKGFREITLSANPLWGGKPAAGRLAVSHCETVFEAAPDFSIVGKSQLIGLDVLAHNKLPIWTFQSHPEATPPFLKRMGIEPPPLQELNFGHSLVNGFLEMCGKRAVA